jgi:16S rRNA (uracil1498-N3)-methyltransferase
MPARRPINGAGQGKMAGMAAQRRIHVKTQLSACTAVRLGAEAANHVLRVLRLREGDGLTVFDGSGMDFPGRIVALGRGELTVELGTPVRVDNESPVAITLLQGICRAARMDAVVQKATELGVTRIVPVATERSVVRLDADQARQKLAHWHGIAISACEQCGRSRIPEIDAVRPLHAGLELVRELPVRIWLNPAGRDTIAALPPSTGAAAVLIGPEGGLSEPEGERVLAEGFTPVRLGPRILRTETAPLAALALLQFRYGDLSR